MYKWICKLIKKLKLKCSSSCCKTKCEIDIDNLGKSLEDNIMQEECSNLSNI